MVVESRSVIRNAKNARGLGRDIFPAATAPFPKSCASYFGFAHFNTFPLYYLRAWHRLLFSQISDPENPIGDLLSRLSLLRRGLCRELKQRRRRWQRKRQKCNGLIRLANNNFARASCAFILETRASESYQCKENKPYPAI